MFGQSLNMQLVLIMTADYFHKIVVIAFNPSCSMNLKLARGFLHTCIAVLCLSSLSAAEYYVSPTGDNGDTGGSGDPWRTIAYALSQVGSGDTINLERDGIFREHGLTLNANRTLRTAPGAGAQAEIRGSQIVSGFTVVGGGIYKASFDPGSSIEQVYINGELQLLARYPNAGWLRTDSGTGNNLIVDSATNFSAAGQWVGGQVRWRKWSWWYETRPITANDGNGNVNLGGSTSLNHTGIGSGYYIDNVLSELDAPGEWYYDAVANELYVYPSVNPATMQVEAAIRDQAIRIRGGTMTDLAVRHFTGTSISLADNPGTISQCTITDIGTNALSVSWNSGGSNIDNNTFEDIHNVAISWNENPSSGQTSYIQNNTLNRIGMIEGYGGSGVWHAAGIIVSNANDLRIQFNRINQTGYAGIIMGEDGQTIHRNVFRRCMSTLNDGGAVYVNAHSATITENIILDTIGDLDSSHPWTPLGHGIWPEFLSEFRDHNISRNTVYGSGGAGLFLPNNFNCTIADNIFLSNRTYGILLSGNDSASHPEQPGHDFTNNVLGIGAESWSASEPQTLAAWATTDDYTLYFDDNPNWDYGSMSGTEFVTQDGNDLIRDDGNNSYTIASWQSDESNWADASPTNKIGDGYLFINDSNSTQSMSLPAGVTWEFINGSSAGSSISLAPYRSAVLIAASGDASAVSAYTLYSETTQPLRKITIRSSRSVDAWSLSSEDPDAPTPEPDMSGSEGSSDALKFGADYTLQAVPAGGG